jgi:23S rRNA C2498 (ribose-2'-O)-methylase RlmM
MRHLCANMAHRGKPHFSVLVPGVVQQNGGPFLDPTFARQGLPNGQTIEASHHEALVQKAFAALPQELQDAQIDWSDQLSVFAPDAERRGSEPFKKHFYDDIAEALLRSLQLKIQGRSRKMQRKGGSIPQDCIVQMLVVGPHRVLLSTTPLQTPASPLCAWPAAFLGGRAPYDLEMDAPSSAYRKLQEALSWLGERFGDDDVVLDAGAAPGGWTHVALNQGAKVYAIDRAKMDPKLQNHPKLTHLRKDAFTTPCPEPITFLICDIIEEPGRVLQWLQERRERDPLRAFIVTLKLKKPLNLKVLDNARSWAATSLSGWEWRIKNLRNNKLEVTFMARCSERQF